MGDNAIWKARHLNDFVANHKVMSVIELGCGDGRQLALANYPMYLGCDVSEKAVELCREKFGPDSPERLFSTSLRPYRNWHLSLSIDVAYHLVEDDVFEQHLDDLFDASRKWAIIYSTDLMRPEPYPESADHVRHRHILTFVGDFFPKWRSVSVDYNDMDGCFLMVFERQR